MFAAGERFRRSEERAIGGVSGRHASQVHGVSELSDLIMKAKKKRGVEAVSELWSARMWTMWGVDVCVRIGVV